MKLKTLLYVVCGGLLSLPVFGQNLTQDFNFSGVLLNDPSGSPMSGAVTVRAQLYNPASDCLLLEETHAVTLDTDGFFSIKVGTGTATANADGDVPWAQIFQNSTQVRGTGSNCSSGYTPSPGQARKLVITAINGANTVTGNYTISAVPMASVAETLAGRTASEFVLKTGSTMSGNLKIDNGGGSPQQLQLVTSSPGTQSVNLQAPASLGSSYTLTLPGNTGTANQVLTTDGAGVLSWSTPATGGSGSSQWTGGADISFTSGSVGIGTVGDTANYILDIYSSSKKARFSAPTVVTAGTSSSSPSTGALVVSGGLGVTGMMNISGPISSSGDITSSSNLIAPFLYGSTAGSGSLLIESTQHANKGNIVVEPGAGQVLVGIASAPVVNGKLYTQSSAVSSSAVVGYSLANVAISATYGHLHGVEGVVASTGAVNIGTAYAGQFRLDPGASGSINTGAGLKVLFGSTGNVQTGFGIYLGPMTNVSTKYGVYQDDPGAKNYFAGKILLGTTVGTGSLAIVMAGSAPTGIGMARATSGVGQMFQVQAAGAAAGSANLNGGNLVLSSGTSTGSGESHIIFQTSVGTGPGSSDNATTTAMVIAGTKVGIGTTFPNSALDVVGDMRAGRYTSSGGTPSTALQGAVGTGATGNTVSGTDVSGTVEFTSGTASTAVGALIDVNFYQTWPGIPRCVVTAMNAATAGLPVYVVPGSSLFTIQAASVPAYSTLYKWSYICLK